MCSYIINLFFTNLVILYHDKAGKTPSLSRFGCVLSAVGIKLRCLGTKSLHDSWPQCPTGNARTLNPFLICVSVCKTMSGLMGLWKVSRWWIILNKIWKPWRASVFCPRWDLKRQLFILRLLDSSRTPSSGPAVTATAGVQGLLSKASS